MFEEQSVFLYDLTVCLASAMDLISRKLANHHKQVAYLACSIGAETGMPVGECGELALAGMLHDIGALSLKERLEVLQFDQIKPQRHAELSYLILREFKPFAQVAEMVRFHHRPWVGGRTEEGAQENVPPGSHVLHLADRIAVSVDGGVEILGQVEGIVRLIKDRSGSVFRPDFVEAFLRLAEREYFWLDLVSPDVSDILAGWTRTATTPVDLRNLLELGHLFAHVIDFRSPFTAKHSSGVATVAETLARMSGFSERECILMRLAGYLHDLGKLAVPVEILDKPGRLTDAEFRIVRRHTYHTYRILDHVAPFELVKVWGALHHERMDGSGYPFHVRGEDLPLGSRIMAVADVFTGITEDRPYRAGMSNGEAIGVLRAMAGNSALDGGIVALLQSRFDEINSLRATVQDKAAAEYAAFWRQNELGEQEETEDVR